MIVSIAEAEAQSSTKRPENPENSEIQIPNIYTQPFQPTIGKFPVVVEAMPTFPENSENLDVMELAEMVEVSTPVGEMKIDTGNTYVDLSIFGIGALLVAMFVYGKFFRQTSKTSKTKTK